MYQLSTVMTEDRYITFSNAYQHLKNDGERENSNFHEIEIHHSLITEQ